MAEMGGDDMSDATWRLCEALHGEIAGKLRVMLGETALDTVNFTPEAKKRRVDALKLLAAHPELTPEARHESWCLQHLEAGWTFGLEYIEAEKKHPNLMAWDKLPAAVKVKADIFAIVAKYGAVFEEVFANQHAVATRPTDPGPGPIALAQASREAFIAKYGADPGDAPNHTDEPIVRAPRAKKP